MFRIAKAGSFVLIGLLAMAGILLAAGTISKDDRVKPKTQVIESKDTTSTDSPSNSSVLTGEQIKWQVISSGGTRASSTNYAMRGTTGQTAVGSGSSENYQVFQGYWGGGDPPTCCMGAIRGNVDYDGDDEIDISDLVFLVDYMFTGGSPPVCWEEANIDGSGPATPPDEGSDDLDISDLVYLVDYMFTSGPAPVACQ